MHNILIIADGYPSKGLPYSAFIANIAEEMTRQGMFVQVIAPQSLTKHLLRRVPLAPRHFTDTVAGKVIHVYRPYSITAGDGRLGWLTRWCNQWVTTQIARRLQKPDAVYAHFWLNAVMAIPYVQQMHLPLVVATGEDVIPEEQIANDKRAWLKANTKAVVCVSTKNMQESVKLGLADERRCYVMPNAINPKEFYKEDGTAIRQSLGIRSDDFVVAFCGRWNERKGAFRVDEALNQIDDPHIKAIFIGSPMDNCHDEPTYARAVFKGQLPHHDIVHYLNAADVFVLPSLAEGCPNSVVEAMACGLPIISSDRLFNKDVLDATNALLIDPNDVAAIAQAIKTLYANKGQRGKLSQGALDKAKELHVDIRTKRILDCITK